jgi:HAD superfamily hydrolase (TIGR01490 family)
MVHIFDVDRTVVRKTSTEYFLRTAMKEKTIRFSQVSRLPIDWIKYKLTFPDMNFIENTVKKFPGIKRCDLERISEICFEKCIKPNIFSGAVHLIDEALKKGEKVIFATSSFDFIIQPLERFFGISGSLACQLEYSDGITTGSLDGNSFFGPKKKIAAQAWMARNSVTAQDVSFYSDSYTDLPLLEYCGNPIAVNPDLILTRHAKKHGWKILMFKKTVASKKSKAARYASHQ